MILAGMGWVLLHPTLFKMIRVLVTGEAGFIGSHLVDSLIENNYHVAIIDNLSTGLIRNLNEKAIFYEQDLGDVDKLKEIFENEKPELVFHLAAQIDVRKSVENPVEDAKINILNTLNLLELCVKYNIKHFIFSSSGGAIYGDTDVPTKEEAVEKPVSPYGCAKLAIEKYLNFYNKVYGLKYTCLRYANVYGPRQNPKGEAGVISIWFDKMFSIENPIIFGGNQTRDFVYVKDVVKANLLALKDNKNSTYNIGTGLQTSITELFNLINSFFNEKFKAKYEPMKKGEQMRSCLNYNKIREELGWRPEISIERGIRKTYEGFIYSRMNGQIVQRD